MTILIIDDDDQLRVSFQRLLKEEGYSVEGAPSGELGLNLIRSKIPDLVILSSRPVSSNKQLVKRLRLRLAARGYYIS